jgi:ankyrin repeat protein
MHLISVPDLLKLDRLLPHQEMLSKGLLHVWSADMENKVLFVSHEWLAWDQPDPEGEQLQVLQKLLRRLQDGEVGKVETHFLHQLLKYNKTMTSAEWAEMLPNMMLWIDFLSIPQIPKGVAPGKVAADQQAAIDSIPSYVSKCSMVIVLVPSCVHKDTGINTGFSSWRTRGWCRVEMAAAFLATPDIPLLVVRGLDFAPYFLAPIDTLFLPPGKGCFTCCQRQHKVNGATITCDKVKIRPVVESMLFAKVKHLFKIGDAQAARYFEALRPSVWLDGMPKAAAAAATMVCSPCDADAETDDAALEQLETRLRLAAEERFVSMPIAESSSSSIDVAADEGQGWPLLCFAALAGDVASTRALVRKGADVNASVPKDYPWGGVPKGLTPLMCAAMCAPFGVVEVLLDAGADPHAVARGTGAMAGAGAFHFAAVHGREETVRGWLTRFPSCNLEQKGVMLGFTALNFACGNGMKRAPLARALLDARADVQSENHLGCPALSYLANKEDEDLETARLLLERGANVNAQQEPSSLKWRLMMTGVKASVRYGSGSALAREMATWDRSSALHFAAQRGHVDLARLLIAAGADPELRNAQKMTALQLARATYGTGFKAMEAVFADAVNGNALRYGGSLRRSPRSNAKGQSREHDPASSAGRTACAGG